MTNQVQKMSASYKAIFIFSIFMVFFVLIAGAATQSKSSGLGIWIWGYTAWLMYKRRNSDLASFYKVILWFDIIAFCVVISVIAFSDNDVSRYIEYSLGEAFFLFIIIISITYGLFKYFTNLSISGDDSFKSIVSDEGILWEQVSVEIKKGERVDSLWARAFSDADGDLNKANARYIKLRVEQLSKTFKSQQTDSIKNIVDFGITKYIKKNNLKLLFVFLFIIISIVFTLYQFRNPSFLKKSPVSSYLGISLNSSMDEVKYILGSPSEVLYKDKSPFNIGDGTTIDWALVQATKEEISIKKGVNNFYYWQFNLPEYRIDVRFDPSLKKVNSIGCYVSDSSFIIPKECGVLSISIRDDESTILDKLGKPTKEEFSGVTKTIFYEKLNLKLYLVKKRLYYIKVENVENVIAEKSVIPNYDDVGWTQESTNSKEIVDWLNYSPKGTRYCRYSDGVIQLLYPPGVKPNAEKANPFCLGNSSTIPK
jgi:hypothetical protein